MSLLSALVRLVGKSLRGRDQRVVTGQAKWVMVVMGAALVSVAVPGMGVGVGVANAQECDPVEVDRLQPVDWADLDWFGSSVVISGDTIVAGAPGDNDNGANSGSAYIFVWSGGVWTQQAKLVPDDNDRDDEFGSTVDISGDTVVVGASRDDDNGRQSGSAYIFTRSGDAWTQQAKLLPDDGEAYDSFGYSVSISNDTVVIAAYKDDDNGSLSGSAYVYTRIGDAWTQHGKLLASDGASADFFGWAVTIRGDTAVVGAREDDDNGNSSGSAYVFTRSGSVWTEQAKLLPDDGATFDYFGHSVSIVGDTAIIGAYKDDDNGTDSGSAYVFTRNGDTWTQQAKLVAGDGTEHDFFGYSVSVEEDTAVIGAVYGHDDGGIHAGSAYVFARNGDTWVQQAELLHSNGQSNYFFGISVSITNDAAIIGAHGDNSNGWQSGSATVFDLGCDFCPADVNGDGIVNTQDFIAFLGAWSAGDPLADWDENGLIDTRDFIAYLADWAAGC